jgi:prepilin-type N-terminal cleavage/methylation domain-containing protein
MVIKKGFTLIELIVVIAIIAILALILVPSIIGFINNAEKSVADANAKECYKIAMLKNANVDYSFSDDGFNIYNGCIIKNTNNRYRVENGYGGAVDIIEVYWFSDSTNWVVNSNKLQNFEEVTQLEPNYGIYTVE